MNNIICLQKKIMKKILNLKIQIQMANKKLIKKENNEVVLVLKNNKNKSLMFSPNNNPESEKVFLLYRKKNMNKKLKLKL